MVAYKCRICGNEFVIDENGNEDVAKCTICGADGENLIEQQHINQVEKISRDDSTKNPLAYPSDSFHVDPEIRFMDEIHEMSVSGRTIIEAMSIKSVEPSWDDILMLGGQLDPIPLLETEEVNTKTVIGPNAAKPLIIDSPVYVSHMSYGALSKEAKEGLARGSAAANTAVCSGEGGILPEEIDNAYKYIFEYVPDEYSVSDENLKRADAIEIKIGQGTKPGIGGLLPGEKVTEEIGKLRGIKPGENVIAPSKFKDIDNKEGLKAKVDSLRERSGGRPIGIKIAAGHIERDLAACVFAGPDFITIDGRGGATAASPRIMRDATSVPTIYALYRARRYLNEVGSDISLVITGGLRVSSDFAKALAMGADAIAIASAALISMACQQYRLCSSGKCPVGIATQDPELRKNFDIEKSSERLTNFLNISLEELKVYARIAGKRDVHELSVDDLCTVSTEISENTNIVHA